MIWYLGGGVVLGSSHDSLVWHSQPYYQATPLLAKTRSALFNCFRSRTATSHPPPSWPNKDSMSWTSNNQFSNINLIMLRSPQTAKGRNFQRNPSIKRIHSKSALLISNSLHPVHRNFAPTSIIHRANSWIASTSHWLLPIVLSFRYAKSHLCSLAVEKFILFYGAGIVVNSGMP